MISLMNPNREEVLFALALEKPAEKRAPPISGGDMRRLPAVRQRQTAD
jgi:hypothetical protein